MSNTNQNQLNDLKAKFYALSDEKMSIEKMEILPNLKGKELYDRLNSLSSQISQTRREIKAIENADRKYTLAEEMQACGGYVSAMTINRVAGMITCSKGVFSVECAPEFGKNKGVKHIIKLSIDDNGYITLSGSAARHISEFIK
jgi:hypothetical protein